MRTITVGELIVPLEAYATVSKKAAAKTIIVPGIVPMAVVFFAVEALPIGVMGILMPLRAYFFGLWLLLFFG